MHSRDFASGINHNKGTNKFLNFEFLAGRHIAAVGPFFISGLGVGLPKRSNINRPVAMVSTRPHPNQVGASTKKLIFVSDAKVTPADRKDSCSQSKPTCKS